MMKRMAIGLLAVMLSALLCGCASTGDAENEGWSGRRTEGSPPLPNKLTVGEDGVPLVKVYQADEEKIEEIDVESYLMGVVAGEMKTDWPIEALKAQAILARTFVMKFCSEKESKYAGADISTDIEEAQAYDATAINEAVERAVSETRGMVLSYRGELPYSWFHAHSGGVTAGAREGLNYDDDPPYIHSVDGRESHDAPDSAKSWTASFAASEVIAAAKKAGVEVSGVKSVEIGEKGDSGRALTLIINGQSVSAPEMRLALGATKMRSTLLTELSFADDVMKVSGKGYGHGVGMTQWGAYALANEGKSAEDIVLYYFRDVTVESMW